MTTTEVARTDLPAQIRKMESAFQLAMPRGAEAKQLIRDALTCLQTNPKLRQAEQNSLLGALMTCAQLGLRPGVGALGQAYILPFWDRKAGGQKAQLVIGYQGYVELAHRSGRIASIHARTVYSNDLFTLKYGAAGDDIEHIPTWVDGTRGEAVMFYAVGRTTDGGYSMTDPMTVKEMEAYRDRHATARDKSGKVFGPWIDHFEAMAHKGLALDTPIPTPAGWTTMGDVREGDTVFDMAGQQTTVTAKSEVKNIGCYRVTFSNGDTIVCDEEHRWVAAIGRNAARDGWSVLTIGDLYAAKESGQAVVIPVAGELEVPDTDIVLPVDPWLLGYWLGDGSGTAREHGAHVSFTAHRDVLAEVQQRIHATTPYRVGGIWPDKRSNAVQFGVRGGLAKELANLGVLGDKHVPAEYLRASADDRLALLQGLIDSDGSIDKRRGRVRFINTNRRLVDAVAELAASLGQVAHVVDRGGSWEVAFTPSVMPATLSVKVARVRPRKVKTYRSVRSVERIDSVPTQCIAVDSSTRTYLAGKSMAPTHNTMIRKLMKLLPKSTEIQRAMAQDDSVRIDLSPNAVDAEPTYIDAEAEEEPAQEPQS